MNKNRKRAAKDGLDDDAFALWDGQPEMVDGAAGFSEEDHADFLIAHYHLLHQVWSRPGLLSCPPSPNITMLCGLRCTFWCSQRAVLCTWVFADGWMTLFSCLPLQRYEEISNGLLSSGGTYPVGLVL